MVRSPLKPIDLERELPAPVGGPPPLKLSAGVGQGQPNKPGDVALVQYLLRRIGQRVRRPGARPGDNFSGRIDGRWSPAAGRALGVVLRNDLAFAVLAKAGHRGPLAAPPTVTPDNRVAAGGKVFAHLVSLAKLEPAARRLATLPEMARPYLRADAAGLARVKASPDRVKTLPDRLRPQYRRLLELGFKEFGLLPVIAGHVAGGPRSPGAPAGGAGTPGSGGGPSRASAGFWLDLADFRFIGPTGQVMRGLAALTAADHAARAALNKRLLDLAQRAGLQARLQNGLVRLANGLLPAPPHDASGHTWHHGDAYLVAVTKYGVARVVGQPYPNAMPIYDDVLSVKEIVAVLSYIKSQWPAEIRKRHDRLNQKLRAQSN